MEQIHNVMGKYVQLNIEALILVRQVDMYNIEFQNILSGLFSLFGVIVGGLITYCTNKRMFKVKVVRSYKQKQLQKLYLPIKKKIMPFFDSGLYDNLDENTVNEILKIIESNIELADRELESYYWEYLEIIGEREAGNRDACFHTQDFTSYIDEKYTKLRDDLFLKKENMLSRFKNKIKYLWMKHEKPDFSVFD